MNSEQKWQKAREILNGNPSENELHDGIHLLNEAISDHHPGAFFTLGQIYHMGKYVEQDKAKAYELYNKALELGYNRAKLGLAMLLAEGEVVEKDITTAEEYLRELAEQDDVDACANLAHYILCDLLPNSDKQEGFEWLKKAAELGHSVSMARYGEVCGNMCKDEEAIFWFNKAIEAGVNDAEEAMKQYTPETYAQRRMGYISYCINEKEYTKVSELIERDAAKGDDDALRLIAYFCVYGMGDEQYGQDIEKGMSIYEDLSDKGDPDADYNLGRIYEQYPVKQDIEKAFQYYIKSAEGGDAAGQYSVGRFYNDGLLGEINKEEAQKWIEAAAAQDHRDALFTMACSYIQDPDVQTLRASNLNYEKDTEKGTELLMRAAQLGLSEAFYVLAICHHEGKYVEQDDEKAFAFLQNSLQAGAMPASVCLMGDFYRDGIGTEQNYEAAAYHYQWCADNGDAIAMLDLAQLYDEGKGVEKNEEKAQELRIKSSEMTGWKLLGIMPLDVAREQAKQGDTEAMFQLGNRYQEGRGVEQNIDVASDWWMKAAMKGHAMACHDLGLFYLYQQHDIENTLKWLEKAVEHNNTSSLNLLGDIYLNGWGVDADVEKAIEYLTTSFEAGDKEVPIKLAGVYHDGTHVERDEEKARLYLEKYLEYDSADAHYRMGQSLLNGDMYDQDYDKALEHLRIAVKGRCYDAAPMYISLLWGDNGVGKNQQEVIDTFTELATEWDGTAWNYLYQLYVDESNDNRDTDKAIECLTKAVELGCDEALTTMGLRLQNGDLLPKDEAKGFECLDKAANNGHIPAFVNVALCYREGRGVEKNVQKALDMLCAAGDYGDAFAAREAAGMLYHGHGIEKDEERAVALLEKHAETDVESCYMLAYIFNLQVNQEDGYSWEKISKAAQLMEKAAMAGHPDAIYLTAGHYMHGCGVFVDTEKAKSYYEQCISQDYKTDDCKDIIEKYLSDEQAAKYTKYLYWHAVADNNKSKLSEDIQFTDTDGKIDFGKIIEAAAACGEPNAMIAYATTLIEDDADKAEEYFGKVIELGRADLALDLGRMYFFGNGVEEDLQRAASYFSKGVVLGDHDCMMFLALLYRLHDDDEMLEAAKELYGTVYSESPEDSKIEKSAGYYYGEIIFNELQNGKTLDDFEAQELLCLIRFCAPHGHLKLAGDALVKMAEEADSVEVLKMVPTWYLQAGETQTAFEIVDYYLEHVPDDDYILIQRADCNALLCRDEEALKDYKEEALLQDGKEMSRANYVNLLNKLKRYQDTIDFVNKSVESGFSDCELLVRRGLAYKALGDNVSAENDFATASEMPVDDDSELTPAYALLLLGRYDECREMIESGIDTLEDGLNYTMCFAYNNAAYYHCLMGDKDKAVEYFNKSVETGYILFDYMKAYKPELMEIAKIKSYVTEHTSK